MMKIRLCTLKCLVILLGVASLMTIAGRNLYQESFVTEDSNIQILSVYERSIEVFFFFFQLFLLRMRRNLLIHPKMSISRLLWGDRWKLQREIQRHAIVTTYIFMTNDRCEDNFVQISRLQLVSNDIQVYQCIFRGLRIAQIPMKEGAALGIWMICTRFEVYVCSYVEQSSKKFDQFFF